MGVHALSGTALPAAGRLSPDTFLGTLEALHREWGPLAYGPGGDRPSANDECAVTPPPDLTEATASEWEERIVSTIRALTAGKRNFSLLEIGAAGFSLTPRLRSEFPDADSYVACPRARSCPVHRAEGNPGVRLYEVDPRQILATKAGKRRRWTQRHRLVDIAVFLAPSILSPLERVSGSERYLPEVAAKWLNYHAGFFFAAVHERASPFVPGDGEWVRPLAASPSDLVLLCGSGIDPIPAAWPAD